MYNTLTGITGLSALKAAQVDEGVSGLDGTYSADLMSPEDALRYDDFWRNNGIGSNNTWEGFKNANPNSSIDDYFKLVKGESPWPDGFTPQNTTLKSGDTFEIVLNGDQPVTNPGRFATTSEVPNVEYVRNDLAVKDLWKSDPSVVAEYNVKEGIEIPALTGPIGPQVDLVANKYLSGGADQINILLGREINMMDYLNIKSIKYIE